MFKPRVFLAPVAALALVLLLACGGDKESDDSSSSSGGSSSSSSQASSSGGGSGQIDLAKATSTIQDLKSFRFDLSMKMDLGDMGGSGSSSDPMNDAFAAMFLGMLGDIKATGSFVKPDQMEMNLKLGGQDMSLVQLGDKAWMKIGSAKWTPTDAEEGLGLGTGTPMDLFSEFLPEEILKGGKTSNETVNGVKTKRYSYDKKALEALAQDLGEVAELKELSKANMDIWLMDDAIPVKLLLDFAGKNEDGGNMSIKMEMNLKDINSDIKIKAPI